MYNKNTDELIDAFLSARKVEASDSFMSAFEARLDSERKAEVELDAMLKAQRLEASSGFADAVMRKIRLLRLAGMFKTIVPAFAAAASVALIFSVFSVSARHSVDENRICMELADIDSQLASLDYFEQLSMNYDARGSAAAVAYLSDDTF